MELSVATVQVPPRLDVAGVQALNDALTAALASADTRVVALVGAPGRFCLGMDLSTATGATLPFGAYAELLLAVRGADRPMVAVVDGEALGGGLGLAAACDLVLASPSARFGLPEAIFGLVPAMVLPIIAERVSPTQARRLALSGGTVSAGEAQSIGLVDRVSADLRRALHAEARRLTRAATSSVRWLRAPPAPLADAVRHGAQVTAGLLSDPSVRARLEAFAQGDPPWELP